MFLCFTPALFLSLSLTTSGYPLTTSGHSLAGIFQLPYDIFLSLTDHFRLHKDNFRSLTDPFQSYNDHFQLLTNHFRSLNDHFRSIIDHLWSLNHKTSTTDQHFAAKNSYNCPIWSIFSQYIYIFKTISTQSIICCKPL